ncbi:pyrimidine 5'-nucleotidase [Pseudooceanicola sediminis]|uniref:Pyrimidine 5'-nucleotidase n=1 Tax=Pseudooceanicola sediminis TaxID=2211117 RepID=A0A399IX45_9RHOB|nr:pyrimidine 5'-nucleotidase [Pseudooceanicola sediminis]KAA2313120.1 pyrimidine 5'-nucleotidase [Puniceibacterium sp. HSS470]RII37768.1 pyrimidine 5'-nucleotidase [Pseudooceanicola sediminis]|tara:strand:- start:60985 stop:61629 length:645 start_codon:yes stop_codon:yes gene_type:complete
MPNASFSHVTTWVFDLDNTLYHPSARLFDQIKVRMRDWVMDLLKVDAEEADRLRGHYWRTHGTTLSGLMREHGIDPLPFQQHVHDIDLTHLQADPLLASHIRALPGRKIIFTNGSAPYAERVSAARGLEGLFDAIYGVEHAGFLPKPERAAFDAVFAADGFDPTRAAMFEDDPRNLAEPFAMGLRCVHVAEAPFAAEHIHFHTDDLSGFLGKLL